MTQAELLYQLQLVDSEHRRDERALGEAEAGLGETRELRHARQMMVEEEEALSQWNGRVRDLDLELRGLNDKIQSTEQRLYSGKVRNPKELGNLQADLEHLRRRRDSTEDRLFEAMTEVDDREARATEARELFNLAEGQWSEEQGRLRAAVAKLRQELSLLEERRNELRATIRGSDLALYDRLVRSKGGVAVAALKGDLCGACRVRVPSGLAQRVRQGQELVTCNNCGRVIVKG